MSTLAEHIKASPKRTMQEWADSFGISRPYLYSLVDGSRFPSLSVAARINNATGGNVPVTSWPNLSAIVEADDAARQGKPLKKQGAA